MLIVGYHHACSLLFWNKIFSFSFYLCSLLTFVFDLFCHFVFFCCLLKVARLCARFLSMQVSGTLFAFTQSSCCQVFPPIGGHEIVVRHSCGWLSWSSFPWVEVKMLLLLFFWNYSWSCCEVVFPIWWGVQTLFSFKVLVTWVHFSCIFWLFKFIVKSLTSTSATPITKEILND